MHPFTFCKLFLLLLLWLRVSPKSNCLLFFVFHTLLNCRREELLCLCFSTFYNVEKHCVINTHNKHVNYLMPRFNSEKTCMIHTNSGQHSFQVVCNKYSGFVWYIHFTLYWQNMDWTLSSVWHFLTVCFHLYQGLLRKKSWVPLRFLPLQRQGNNESSSALSLFWSPRGRMIVYSLHISISTTFALSTVLTYWYPCTAPLMDASTQSREENRGL